MKTVDYQKKFDERIKKHMKTPEWWIEGIELHLGEAKESLDMLRKLLKKRKLRSIEIK